MRSSITGKKAFFLKILILNIALLFSVGFLELGFQIVSTAKIDNFAKTQEWHKKYVVRNSKGYRDKEYSYEKPEGVFRILVLGDSQTFGHGINKLEDTWHKKLENSLNKNLDHPRFEIISLAGEGWNTDTQLYELFLNGFKFNPDLVLLAFYHNDIPRSQFFDCQASDIDVIPAYKILKIINENSEFYRFLKFRINRLLETLNWKNKFSDCINEKFQSRSWEMEKIYLNTFLTTSRVKKYHFMIAHIPLLHELGDKYSLKSSHKVLKDYS